MEISAQQLAELLIGIARCACCSPPWAGRSAPTRAA